MPARRGINEPGIVGTKSERVNYLEKVPFCQCGL
jgi:hypothetical protein